MRRTQSKGFTLIELMIVMAIVAILGMIAVPSYRNYMITARRSDATQNLTKLTMALENCYSLNNTYENCISNDQTSLLSDVSAFYDFTSVVDRNHYYLTVTAARGTQVNDIDECKTLTVNHLGRRYSNCVTTSCTSRTGAQADPSKCW